MQVIQAEQGLEPSQERGDELQRGPQHLPQSSTNVRPRHMGRPQEHDTQSLQSALRRCQESAGKAE